MTVALVSALILILIMDVIILIWWPGAKMPPPIDRSDQPLLSILIALRDEEQNISGLIENLLQLDYPRSKLQILLGDDRSSDNTRERLEETISEYRHFQIIPIYQDIASLVGKANVIAQLIPYAKSDYLFITDADVRVPKDWLNSLLVRWKPNIGVLGGCTVVAGNDLWSQLQNMDWLLAQAMLFTSNDWYRNITVSGTNMMITKQTCDAIGGYDNIPYSLTEDVGFVLAAKAKGFTVDNVWGRGSCATISPQENWSALLKQRSRWTYGALKLPGFEVMALGIRALFLPLVLILAFEHPWWACALVSARVILQSVLVKRIGTLLDQRIRFETFVLFEVYYALVTLGGFVLHVLPIKYGWKGRNY